MTAGSHEITATYIPDNGNFATSNSKTAAKQEVDPAELTVTASNQDMAHGGHIPPLTYTITGFVSGDTVAVVSGTPTLTALATPASSAGLYAILVSGGSLSADNYDFDTFVPGILTIHPAVVDVRVQWGTQSISLMGLTRDLPFVNVIAIDVIFSDNVVVTKANLARSPEPRSASTASVDSLIIRPWMRPPGLSPQRSGSIT